MSIRNRYSSRKKFDTSRILLKPNEDYFIGLHSFLSTSNIVVKKPVMYKAMGTELEDRYDKKAKRGSFGPKDIPLTTHHVID